jgi:hypothetical protein
MRTTKMLACLGMVAVVFAVPALAIAEDDCSGYELGRDSYGGPRPRGR